MAFLEWRRFAFFDIHKNIDNGKIAECLQDTKVSVSTSGNSHVVLCDVTGWAHLISRSWEITSFKAYEITIFLAQQFQHDPYLITVGLDIDGGYPELKVWDWSRRDRHGSPVLVRTARVVPSQLIPVLPTALAYYDKNLLAVGFESGSVVLFRGDLTRQRSGKIKTIVDSGTSPITGLAFKDGDKLFIVSRSTVSVYSCATERATRLGALGAAPHCTVLAHTQRLMVATALAIYCYTTEGRGPCYALEGEKLRLNWFRNYLVIITKEILKTDASTSSAPTPQAHHLTILDIQNKFIVFSKTFDELEAVITEWGSFYILTKDKELIYLGEKDLDSKLNSLFKKNLYDVAIRIASSQHYDAERLTEIYKQYGDHLYAKGDLKGAIDQYVKTIGWLETSYVIRKYLESRHLEPLVVYLEELHKKGAATEEHTSLLLTCYVKVEQLEPQGKLRDFVAGRDRAIDFDVDIAIKVVRQVSSDDAFTLASNHKRHDWCLKILLEDKKDYVQAVEYISELEFEDAETFMKKYGHTLVQHAPEESTDLLKLLCTDYKPRSSPLVSEAALNGQHKADRASPDDFLHLFVHNSQRLIHFLEHMLKAGECSTLVYNALLDHYVHVWAQSSESEKTEYESKIMSVLRDPSANYDKDQVLVICQMLDFRPGILYLYEENKLWSALVSYHLRSGTAAAAVSVCEVRGSSTPRLWLDVLASLPPPDLLPHLLNVVGNQNLLSPVLVVDCLADEPKYTLGDVRKYLTTVLKNEDDVICREQELATKYREETQSMKQHIECLKHSPVTFQRSRCAACQRQLELPSVHFLCEHSYHQHCFQSYSEHESVCPACERGPPPPPPPPPDSLHHRLGQADDSYAVLSEYFGRGLFNKITLVEGGSDRTPSPPPAPHQTTKQPPPNVERNYGAGAEAKLRLQEGQSKQVYIQTAPKQVIPKGTAVIPVPEGRMRLMERQQYSSSLEANITRLPEPVHRASPLNPSISQSVSQSVSQSRESIKTSSIASETVSSNPFEENYDESKNPFADEEEKNDPTNPFAEDDDYDKNLNPFAE